MKTVHEAIYTQKYPSSSEIKNSQKNILYTI